MLAAAYHKSGSLKLLLGGASGALVASGDCFVLALYLGHGVLLELIRQEMAAALRTVSPGHHPLPPDSRRVGSQDRTRSPCTRRNP